MNAQSNNTLYFIVGALVVLVGIMGYMMYTGNGGSLAPQKDGVHLQIGENGIKGTINTDGQ